jgi:hypothetical protein
MASASAKDDLHIPAFLRRKPGERRKKSVPVEQLKSSVELVKPVERVQLTEFVRLAETPAEEGGFAIDEGVLPRRWYDGDPESEQVVQLHLRMAKLKLKEEIKAEREAKPERVSPVAGLVRLDELIVAMKPVPELDTAKRALRAGGFHHVRY